jgi:hypothetical protein
MPCSPDENWILASARAERKKCGTDIVSTARSDRKAREVALRNAVAVQIDVAEVLKSYSLSWAWRTEALR